jgi:UDP-glucose/iron transport system ATP-binding protein
VLFQLEEVRLARGGRQVLDGFSAAIPAGVSALVGPSGSGKSTVLRLLDRLSDPDSGTVSYEGTDVRDRDPLALRREVCLVPQLPALLAGTVADNICFAAGLAGSEPDVAELLGHAGLSEDYAERDVGRLSVGERQRGMLARALALEPRVLLLDEPTSALDAEARDAVEATISRLAGDLGVSIVLVTHDREQAGRLASYEVGVEAGRSTGSRSTNGTAA